MSKYLQNKAINRVLQFPKGSRTRNRLLRTYKLTESQIQARVKQVDSLQHTDPPIELDPVEKNIDLEDSVPIQSDSLEVETEEKTPVTSKIGKVFKTKRRKSNR